MSKSIKIESLIFLKSLGIAPEPLLFFEKLPCPEEFLKQLKKSGFNKNQKIIIRFSGEGIMEMPKMTVFDNFHKIYDFIKMNLANKKIAIIHPFIEARYVSTIYFYHQKIFINLIKNNIWDPSVAKNCDIFLIDNKRTTIYRYLKERVVYFFQDNQLKRQRIKPLKKKEINKLLLIFKQQNFILNNIKKFKNIILEFIISPDDKFYGMEMEYSTKPTKLLFSKINNFFPIKNYKDIKKWDKKQKLLLSIDVFRQDKDKFLQLIEEIKPYQKEVFIEYGLLSHPAILLREQGINTKPYIKDYEIINKIIKR